MNISRFFAALAVLALAASPAAAETIAVIGTGNVGGTLGKKWAAAGHTIIYGSRTPGDERVQALVKETGHGAGAAMPAAAAARADIVFIPVPGEVFKGVVEGLGDLSGKIVLDPINAVKAENNVVMPSDNPLSVAEQIQAMAPGATVVKAFNTLNFRIMQEPALAGGPVTIPISGDDAAAKARVAKLVEAAGLEPLDVGPLVTARYTEDMLRLYSTFRRQNPGKAFEYHLRVRPN